MSEDRTFYTVTMARVHAAQGNYQQAEAIYRYLIAQDPHREELVQALAEVEQQRKKASLPSLAPLFREWIDLTLQYNRMRKLKRLSKNLERTPRKASGIDEGSGNRGDF